VHLDSGIEIGNIFKLGTRYTEALGANYFGEDGQSHPIVMGSYGIGLGRCVACIVEAHHDDKGIVWPESVAPYRAHLVTIGANKDPKVSELAERFESLAAKPDLEILYDDRNESAGVKLTDAELLGMPWILTLSPRSIAQDGVEVTCRRTGDRTMQPIERVEAFLQGLTPSPC
jgi:prolyl-tRNA synthetase